MIAYGNMTLQQAYDTVVMRLSRYRSAINTDWSTIVRSINRAIREAVLMHLPYKEWVNNYTLAVTHRLVLPLNYLAPIRVLLSVNGLPPYMEARRTDPREFYQINSWYGKNPWNQGVNFMPAYTIWGEVVLGIKRQVIHVSPNADFETAAAPAGYAYNGVTMSGMMEYYAVPPFITLQTAVLPVAYEMEDLVVMLALERTLAKFGELNEVTQAHVLVEKEKARLVELYKEKKRTAKRELVSYVEPVPPVVQAPPQKDEARER